MSGLSADTIRFYERRQVLPRPPRRENGYREYTTEHVTTLRLAKGLRELGLPLREFQAILTVAHDGACTDLRAVLLQTVANALDQVDARRREVQHHAQTAGGDCGRPARHAPHSHAGAGDDDLRMRAAGCVAAARRLMGAGSPRMAGGTL